MIPTDELHGKSISLRPLLEKDCTVEYLNWLKDPEVNRFLESRWDEQSLDTIKSFVKSVCDSSHSFLFAIIADDDLHIGNLKIGPIHPIYRCADIGYLIGKKNYWGRGIATEAVGLATEWAFRKLKLHRLQGGVYVDNRASCRVFEKNGYSLEGILHKKYLLYRNGPYTDCRLYSLLAGDFLLR